jgi:hypothetical protein
VDPLDRLGLTAGASERAPVLVSCEAHVFGRR